MVTQRTQVQNLETSISICFCFFSFFKNTLLIFIIQYFLLGHVYSNLFIFKNFIYILYHVRDSNQGPVPTCLEELSINLPPSQHKDLSRIFFSIQECICGIRPIQGKMRSTFWTVWQKSVHAQNIYDNKNVNQRCSGKVRLYQLQNHLL